jgi:hypothetical protein
MIQFRFQIALFGNFEEIAPTIENTKFFMDAFYEKGFMPSQFNELNLSVPNIPASNTTRLSLTSNDSSWNIMFGKERLDCTLTNINIGIFNMPDKGHFISFFHEVFNRISQKFPKKVKRIGFVCQYLINNVNIDVIQQKINVTPTYFNEYPLIEFTNRYACRETINIPNDEIINVSGELSWIKNSLTINNQNSLYDGLILNIDINTIIENQDYRFEKIHIEKFLQEASDIEDKLRQDYLNMIND